MGLEVRKYSSISMHAATARMLATMKVAFSADGLFKIDPNRNCSAILWTPRRSVHVNAACVNALPIDIRFCDIQGPYDVQWT